MIFEDGETRVIAPIDPTDSRRYVEPVKKGFDLENIYNLTSRKEDYVNPTTDGNLSWRSVISCASDPDEGLENWQNRLHEVSMRRCAHLTKSLC